MFNYSCFPNLCDRHNLKSNSNDQAVEVPACCLRAQASIEQAVSGDSAVSWLDLNFFFMLIKMILAVII